MAALLGTDTSLDEVPTDGDRRAHDDTAPAVAEVLAGRARSSGLIIGVVAVVVLPAWALMDALVEPDLAGTFTVVRLGCAAVMAVLVWVLWARPVGRRRPEMLTLAILTVVQVDIAWMVAQVDHVESYALGLTLALYGSGGVMAAPVRWTGAIVGITWLAMGAAAVFSTRSILVEDLASVVFYLGTASIVAIVTHGLRQTLALRELRSRIRLEREQQRTAVLLAQLERLSLEDPLTGVANRRRWDAELGTACAAARRTGGVVAAVLVDIDHFKTVNDRHGHAGGDEVLRAVAGLLTAAVRAGDLVARLGGDELAVLMPGADLACAVALAERLRAETAGLALAGFAAGELSLSLGVATVTGGQAYPMDLMSRADEQLYRAKITRNAVGAPRPPVGAGTR
jgi:diguanylate cyclase (GGDEF)-like protein